MCRENVVKVKDIVPLSKASIFLKVQSSCWPTFFLPATAAPALRPLSLQKPEASPNLGLIRSLSTIPSSVTCRFGSRIVYFTRTSSYSSQPHPGSSPCSTPGSVRAHPPSCKSTTSDMISFKVKKGNWVVQ